MLHQEMGYRSKLSCKICRNCPSSSEKEHRAGQSLTNRPADRWFVLTDKKRKKKYKRKRRKPPRQHGLRNKTIPQMILTWKKHLCECPHTPSPGGVIWNNRFHYRDLYSTFYYFQSLHTQLYPGVDLKNGSKNHFSFLVDLKTPCLTSALLKGGRPCMLLRGLSMFCSKPGKQI